MFNALSLHQLLITLFFLLIVVLLPTSTWNFLCLFIDGSYVRYLSLIFVGFLCFCLILNLGIYIYIYIYKLCFLLKKEGEEKADWEASNDRMWYYISIYTTPHHTIHVTAKMRCGVVTVLAKLYTVLHHTCDRQNKMQCSYSFT